MSKGWEVKRRDLVGELVSNGFWSKGGTNHELFTDGKVTVAVPRHREINELTARKILKDAGLR